MTDHFLETVKALNKRGASNSSHSRSTLLHHLVGTYHLLLRWHAEQYVAIAGLVHSVYGRREGEGLYLERERQDLKELIGEEAERLAFWHSRDFPELLTSYDQCGETQLWLDCELLHVDSQSFQNLLLISVANLFEQLSRNAVPHDWLQEDLRRFIKLRKFLPAFLADDLLSVFGEKTTDPGELVTAQTSG